MRDLYLMLHLIQGMPSISLFDVETGAELYAIDAYKGGIYHDHAPEILPYSTYGSGPRHNVQPAWEYACK